MKEPLSIPFHGINKYATKVDNIKNNNKLVNVIIFYIEMYDIKHE